MWWDTFYQDQFHWIPDNYPALTSQVWDVVLPVIRPNVPLEVEGIRVPHSVPVLTIRDRLPDSLDELKVDELVAVRPPNNFVPDEEDSDFPPEKYWIAVITAINPADDEPIALSYYCQSHTNMRRYRLDPKGSSGTCGLNAILCHGFELTSTRLLRSVTRRALGRILQF